MRLINKVSEPGTIRAIEIAPETVRILMVGGVERVYKLEHVFNRNEGASQKFRFGRGG